MDWKGHLYVPMFYDGKLVAAIFDPGAECTSITTGLLERRGVTNRMDTSMNVRFNTADDSESVSPGILHHVRLCIPPLACSVSHMFVTKSTSYDVLVGLDIIKYYQMRMDIR